MPGTKNGRRGNRAFRVVPASARPARQEPRRWRKSRQDSWRAGVGLAGMTVNARFHRLPFFVPDIRAAGGTDQFCLPETFVELDRVLRGIKALPLIEHRQIVPGQELLSGLVTAMGERLECAQKP